MELYELADYLSLPNLKELIAGHLENLIDQSSLESILEFSTAEKLENLALACAQLKLKEL